MDALIRAARLGPLRRRLSEIRPARAADHGAPQSDARDHGSAIDGSPLARRSVGSQVEILRGEIESQVRAELVAQAQEQYETAHASGLADGRAAAVAEVRKEASEDVRQAIETLTANVRSAISALEKAHQAALLKLEASVGEVAFAAVCRLVSDATASQHFVLGLVERTCAQLRADMNATARLHPRDIDVLRELLQEQELRVHSIGLTVVPDESLELGGCVIEAASGQYDGGLENQLRRLHAILTGAAKPGMQV